MHLLLAFVLHASAAPGPNSISNLSFPKEKTIELTMRNTLIFNSDIDIVTADNFAASLLMKRILLPKDQTLNILLASGGGTYQFAQFMVQFIEQVPNVRIICKACHSAAAYIMAATHVPKFVMENSTMVLHEMFLEKVTARTANDGASIESLKKESAELNKIMADAMKLSVKSYYAKIENTEWSLEGEEIVKNHLANKLITVKCDALMHKAAPRTCKGD